MKKTHVIVGRKVRKTVDEHIHLDIQSKEELFYILHVRAQCGIHYKELNELAQCIYAELLENKEVVRIGERIYKPFMGTSASQYLQTLWDTSCV